MFHYSLRVIDEPKMSEIRILNLCHKKSILVDFYRQSLLISFLFPGAFATQRTIHWKIVMWNISQAFQNSPQRHLAGSHRVKDFPIVSLGLERVSKRAYFRTSAELVLWHSVCQGTSFPPLTTRMLSRCLKTALLNAKPTVTSYPFAWQR